MILKKSRDSTDLDFIASKVNRLERVLGDAEQRLFRPLGEPIDGAAVDDGREHATSRAEGAANGTHAQHDVQVVAHAVDEELVDGVAVALGDADLLGSRATADDDALVLVGLEQVGHLARVQHVVDVFQELFYHDLSKTQSMTSNPQKVTPAACRLSITLFIDG